MTLNKFLRNHKNITQREKDLVISAWFEATGMFNDDNSVQQNVQRIGFKRPLIARIGYFFIRKGWRLVGYANR